MFGSSPHTRGTLDGGLPPCLITRFIPAYAGNAPAIAALRTPLPVHPRIRGERISRLKLVALTYGSSPHTRGTPHPGDIHQQRIRFIPAYAGNAMTRMFLWDTTAVHPRIRGERPYTAHASERSAGSSPHTRGTPGPLEFTRPAARFIPAYAGNAWSASSSRARRSVHPRIRGERKSCCADRSFRRGSSPHTRGTPAGLDAGAAMTRFIPAYAGNAQWIRKRCREPPVHPRIRGERLHSCSHTGQCFGSSPHTRGTRVVSKNYLCCNPVHPRIRGERVFSDDLV